MMVKRLLVNFALLVLLLYASNCNTQVRTSFERNASPAKPSVGFYYEELRNVVKTIPNPINGKNPHQIDIYIERQYFSEKNVRSLVNEYRKLYNLEPETLYIIFYTSKERFQLQLIEETEKPPSELSLAPPPTSKPKLPYVSKKVFDAAYFRYQKATVKGEELIEECVYYANPENPNVTEKKIIDLRQE